MSEHAWAVGQLRHLYKHMLSGNVKDTAEAARGLLGPAIEKLEPFNDIEAALTNEKARAEKAEAELAQAKEKRDRYAIYGVLCKTNMHQTRLSEAVYSRDAAVTLLREAREWMDDAANGVDVAYGVMAKIDAFLSPGEGAGEGEMCPCPNFVEDERFRLPAGGHVRAAHASCFAVFDYPHDKHTFLCDRVRAALAAAERRGMERAAVAVERLYDRPQHIPTRAEFAASIRALVAEQPATEKKP
jgi:hypothetical protein